MSPSIALLGGSGLVGSALRAAWLDLELDAPTHDELDVLSFDTLTDFISRTKPRAVVNLVAWADVDGAEAQHGDTSGTVYRLNVELPRRLAELCAQHDIYLLHVSTDYVFDGSKAEAPYVEDDRTRGVCWYAETKRLGEVAVKEAAPNAGIARIEMPFTGRAHPKSDLARTFATRLQQKLPIQGVTDQRITPLFLEDGAAALRTLVETRHAGVMHVAAADWTTPYDFACEVARRLDLNPDGVTPETFERFSKTRAALRPQHSWLDVSRFTDAYGAGKLRTVQDELDRWARQWQSR